VGRILIVDDEASIRSTLSAILQDDGHTTEAVDSAEAALARLGREEFDAILLDVWLPGIDGLAVLERLKSGGSPIPVIVISGHGNIDTAIRATRLGAYDFLEKPLSLERVLLTVEHAIADNNLRQEVRELRRHFSVEDVLIGESEPMKRLAHQIRSAGASNSRVLITGENGVGKEIVARTLHRESTRRDNPFVDVNCAAIPEELIESELFGHRKGAFTGAIDERKGKFELAHRGTLFLDEIADMSLRTQAKVLRVLQEQKFQKVGGQQTISSDVRVIAATNKTLPAEIENGRFREDLYFRLNVVPIVVPPLRERGSDILLLADHFFRRIAAETGRKPKSLSPEAASRFRTYPWPGNVRELRNVVERLTILSRSDLIGPVDVDFAEPAGARLPISGDLTLRQAREEFEREYILAKLRESAGNVSRAADALGVERSNLYRKLNQYGIRVERP
jgi:two-component system, NtrC family, nitrogen regulation response regulator NtrX